MNIKTKTVKKGTQNIQKSQQRYRQKSKVASQARVNTQAGRVRHSRDTGKVQAKIQGPKTGREIGTRVGRENTGSSTKGL